MDVIYLSDIIQPQSTSAIMQNVLRGKKDVLLMINSPGGGAYEGMALYDIIKAHKGGNVYGYAIGQTASAGAFALLGCSKVFASPRSNLLFHDSWSCACGGAKEMEREGRELERVSEMGRKILAARFQTGTDETKAASAKLLMEKDETISADEALELGIIDGIVELADIMPDEQLINELKTSQMSATKLSFLEEIKASLNPVAPPATPETPPATPETPESKDDNSEIAELRESVRMLANELAKKSATPASAGTGEKTSEKTQGVKMSAEHTGFMEAMKDRILAAANN